MALPPFSSERRPPQAAPAPAPVPPPPCATRGDKAAAPVLRGRAGAVGIDWVVLVAFTLLFGGIVLSALQTGVTAKATALANAIVPPAP